MNLSIIDILIRPDAFFRDLVREKESLKIPALIVLAGSIVGAVYGYLIGGLTGKMMESAMPGIGTFVTLSSVAGALVGTFIFWLIWSAIVFLISFAFKGTGSFNRVMEVVGYGYLPQILGSVITLIVAALYLPAIRVPSITQATLQDPAAMQEVMKTFLHDPAMLALTQITSLISIVFLLWSANIWIFGLKHARALTVRDAAICVAIPVVVYILYLTYTLGAA